MSRFFLAWSCFFRVLFGKKLPADNRLLTDGAPTERVVEKVVEKIVERPVDKPADKPKVSTATYHKDGALALLALLQREGRLVDFLRDPEVGNASDADLGAVVRPVHRGCLKVIEQYLSLEPVMPSEEGEKVSVPKGFDPSEIRLMGEAKGEAPYRGTLRHHGWRVVDAKLPTLAEGVDRAVLAPAEVELSA